MLLQHTLDPLTDNGLKSSPFGREFAQAVKFRSRFWISLVLSIPVLIFSPAI
jgi:hypothetical protein